jgi:hypothetical protein
MRLVLSKLLWNFDLELADNSDAWWMKHQQQTSMFWDQLPLMVKLYPQDRD